MMLNRKTKCSAASFHGTLSRQWKSLVRDMAHISEQIKKKIGKKPLRMKLCLGNRNRKHQKHRKQRNGAKERGKIRLALPGPFHSLSNAAYSRAVAIGDLRLAMVFF